MLRTFVLLLLSFLLSCSVDCALTNTSSWMLCATQNWKSCQFSNLVYDKTEKAFVMFTKNLGDLRRLYKLRVHQGSDSSFLSLGVYVPPASM